MRCLLNIGINCDSNTVVLRLRQWPRDFFKGLPNIFWNYYIPMSQDLCSFHIFLFRCSALLVVQTL